jgi:hypothetical protein
MSVDPYGTVPMFAEVPELPVAKPLTDVSGGYGKITYTRYKVKKPVRCDDCVFALGLDPKAPASRPAAFKRTQAGTDALLLCHMHKQLRQEQEAA